MLKSLLLLLFLCPSVWGAAEVDRTTPPFRADGTLDETLVPVHGIVHVPQFFLTFYSAVKDLSVENAKAMQAGAGNCPHTIPELRWFLNDTFKEAFLRHKERIAPEFKVFFEKNLARNMVEGTAQHALYHYLCSFESLLEALVQDIDDCKEGLRDERSFISGLLSSCLFFMEPMERCLGTLSTLEGNP